MRTHIRLGRVFGIQIGLHYSWFLIAALIIVSLGGYFRTIHPDWGAGVSWALAVLTGILFFITLLMHELSHSVVAKAYKLPVRSITLFALGGMAQIEEGPRDARSEFWMAIAGPITSAIIGGICLGIAMAFGWSTGEFGSTPLISMAGWLGYINIALALFNMIPGYPLDGGRVLRALIWWKTGNADRSTRIAARVGQVVGFLFIAWGVVQFFLGAGFGGLWIALIGWFLIQMAGQSYMEVGLRRSLEGVRVGDIMARDCLTVSGRSNLQTFIQEVVLRTGKQCFLVEDNGNVEGLVTPQEVRQVEEAKWPYTTIEDVMQPIDKSRAVAPETPLTEALEMMARNQVNELPVVSGGRLDGVISRFQVAQYFRTRSEFGG